MTEEQQTLPEPEPNPGPETNEEYEKVFGGGEHAVAEYAEDFEISFDPTEAIVPLGKGKYSAVIAEPPKKQVSQNGNPMMVVAFMVNEGEFTGSMQWRRYMLSGKGGGWTVEFLKALDLEEEAEGKKSIKPSLIEGRRLIIHVRPQKDNPDFMEVHKVERHPDGPVVEPF